MKNGPYNLIVAPNDFPGKKYRGRYAYEHTVVWWQNYGVIPKNGFQIHHKNKNHRDNNISNLELLTASEHAKHHGKQRKQAAKIKMICAFCKEKFERKGAQIRNRLKRNNGRLYCGRSCQVKMQWKEGTVGIKNTPG
jgi:tRNA(Ile)-lysidine synthase TilS/MesJ